jgi:palmitoyltransferase
MFLSFTVIQLYYITNSIPYWAAIKSDIVFILSFTFFFLSWLKDPGYLKKDSKIDFNTVLEKFDPNTLCPECEVIRTERSRHCNICNRCVERFDHHCPWINNCVGVRNHAFFFLYIAFTISYIGTALFLNGSVLFYVIFGDQSTL